MIQCFYFSHLLSILINPQDILKTNKNWNKSFSNQDLRSDFFENSNPNYGYCTLTCHQQLCTSQNIVVNSVIMAGNC